MSDHRVEGVDAKGPECSSFSNISQAASPQSAVVSQSDNLPDKSHETDTNCMCDNAASTVNTDATSLPSEFNSNQNASSSVENVNTDECSVGEHLSRSETTAPEASGATAAACGENDGISGVNLEGMIARQRELIDRVRTEREEFVRRIQQAESEIQRAAERMYGAVDNRVNELLAAAAELRSERETQVEQARSRMQSSLVAMNYHHMFAEQLLKHGTPAEVTHYAPLLHADAERLLSDPLPEVPSMSAESAEKLAALQAFANLSLEELRQQAGGNMVGHVTRTETVDMSLPDGVSPYLEQPTLIASTAVDNGVCGTAFLGVHLFVVRDRSSVVEVYDTSQGLVLTRTINVEQMTCPTSIIAYSSANGLFVSDSQVPGLFRIPSSADEEVALIPLDGIPSSLSVTADGIIAVTFAESQTIQMMSAADFKVTGEIKIGSVDRPVSTVPVNGEDNGFVVCSKTDNGSSWFICGHCLEGAARPLEEPVHLQSLSNISGLVPDPFGSYIAFSTSQNSVQVFNSTFELLRLVLSGADAVEHPTAVSLNATSGRLAVGQRNGVIKLYQLLQTRETIEVGICNWA